MRRFPVQLKLRVRGGFLALALACLAGCGAAPAPAPATAPVAAPAPPAPPPDVSAVPMPTGLIVYARASHPSATLQTALGWTRSPPPASQEFGEELAGEPIGDVVDLEQPLDFALLNGGRGMVPAWAIATGVRSLEAVRSALPPGLSLARGKSSGVFWIRPTKGGAEATTERPCQVAPAAGLSPLRLVCAASEEALEYLAPYLTRTATRQTWDTDLHVEVYPEPIKPFARILKIQAPGLLESMLDLDAKSAPATFDLIRGVLGDFVDLLGDLDTTKLDVKLAPEGAEISLQAGFTATTSVLARLATTYPERADVAPASFWRLPDDADTAFFSRGYDPKDLEHARDLLVTAATGMLAKEGLAPADQKAIGGAFDRILSDAPFVFARGSDVVAMQKSMALFESAADGPDKDAAARAALAPYIGFWVFGFEEPPARLQGVMKALSLAANRPGVTQWLKKNVDGVPPPTLRLSSVPAGLPPGSQHAKLEVYLRPDEAENAIAPKESDRKKPPGNKSLPNKSALKPIELHALIVPDTSLGSTRTWMVLAADEKLAVAKVKGLLAATTPHAPGTLGARRGLEGLGAQPENGGGFTSLRAWVALAPEPSASVPGKAGDPLSLLASLPSEGQSPITMTSTALPKNRYTARVFVPHAAIEDIVLFRIKQSPHPTSGGPLGSPPGGKI